MTNGSREGESLNEKVKRILLVDDSSTARMIIKQCLQICGFVDAEFFEAGNGLEALAVLRNQAVDLMVTDMYMPVMDGKTLLKRVSKQAYIPYLAVITSAANTAVEEELKGLGVAVVINKPVTPAKLLNAMENL